MIAAGTVFDLDPCPWRKAAPRERTPRLIRSAERAVLREIARAPLFPETARFHSPGERLDRLDASDRAWRRQMRDLHARHVRTARALLAPLHADHRAALAAEWRARLAPRSPAYLLDWLAGRLDGRRRRPVPIVRRSPRALAALHLDRAAAARRTGDRRTATRAVAAAHSIDSPPLP